MKMKESFGKTLIVALLVSMSPMAGRSSTSVPDTCVPDTLRVAEISGRVISHVQNGESPVREASVTLMKGPENGPVIATRSVDANGRFNFDHLKAGKYRLKVTTPHLINFYVDLILKPDRRAKDEKEIVITIGADFIKTCNGSSAEVRIKKTAGSGVKKSGF